MNRKFVIAWVSIFVVRMVGSFVVHGALLLVLGAVAAFLYRSEEPA